MESKIEYVFELLSGGPLEALKKLSENELLKIDEIRLRSQRPVSLSVGRQDVILDAVAEPEDIEHVFKASFSYSLHSYSKELAAGYITTKGGNRVGLCGTAVLSQERYQVDTLKYISSVNIRVARELKGCADTIVSECFSDGPCGLLLIGAPSSGKTTCLRDICRRLGESYKISLIDELNEISATHKNIAQNDVGRLTDIFVGYPKHVGVSTAVRVMSPRAVVVDEIGSDEDGRALEYALHSGVRLITAVHGVSLEDVLKKPVIKRLVENGAFTKAAVLGADRKPKVFDID